MRSLLAGILASLLFFALAGAAAAHEGATTGTGTLADPDLVALKQAVDEFRTQLAAIADACALTRDADAAAVTDCASRYAALRAEFKKLKQAALVLVRQQHEWAERSKHESDQLKKETEKLDSAKREEDSTRSRSLPDKIKWVDDRLLQDKADLEAAQQHATDVREAAAGLSGDKLEDANAVAAKWDERAAGYAAEIKRLTALRRQLVAALQNPKACTSNTSSCVKKEPTVCALHTSSCGSLRDRLEQQLKALDSTIAYKRQKIADLEELLAYKLAQANATTGEEHDRWLELASGVQREIAQWNGYLTDLLEQREDLVNKVNSTPAASLRDELTGQLKSLDDLAAYKRQKIAEAAAAGDQDAVAEWTAKLNDVLARRAELLARLNALPK